MAAKKFAISIAEEVMDQVDRAAAERQETRSAFIARVLRRIANAKTDEDIRRRVDALFADPRLAGEQKATAKAFHAIRTEAGTEW